MRNGRHDRERPCLASTNQTPGRLSGVVLEATSTTNARKRSRRHDIARESASVSSSKLERSMWPTCTVPNAKGLATPLAQQNLLELTTLLKGLC